MPMNKYGCRIYTSSSGPGGAREDVGDTRPLSISVENLCLHVTVLTKKSYPVFPKGGLPFSQRTVIAQ